MEHLAKGAESESRRLLVAALGNMGESAAVEPLIALLDDPDGLVVQSACTALDHLGDLRALVRQEGDQ